MNEPAKRSWFQLHRSTALCTFVLAAGLLWINVGWKQPVSTREIDLLSKRIYLYEGEGWGFPCRMRLKCTYSANHFENGTIGYSVVMGGRLDAWNWPKAGANLCVAIIVMLAVSVVLETIVRRLEA